MRLFNLAMQIGLCLGSEINQTDPLENWTVALKTNLTLFSDTWKLILTLGLCTHCSLCLECFSLELLAHNSNIDSNVGIYKRWSLTAPPHSFVSVLLSPQYFPLPETILSIDLFDYFLIINPPFFTRMYILWTYIPLSVLFIIVSQCPEECLTWSKL